MKKKLALVSKDVRREPRTDGWQNLATLIGTQADKRSASKINWVLRDPEFYEQLYSAGGIAARIVDIVPDSALREGWEWLNIPKEKKEAFNDRCEQLDLKTGMGKAWKWGRAYGGACLHIVTDTSDPASPLRRGERVLGLRDLSRWDLRVLTTDIEYDFGSPNWGNPRLYYLNVQMGAQYKNYPIHWTRVIRFDGQLVPRRTYIRNNYWHDSVLNRPYDTIRDYQMSNEAAAACLQDFNVDVFKMKQLSALIGAGNEATVKARLDMIEYSKSIINAVAIDADLEEYENKGRAMEGFADLLTKMENRLVAETDIPHTILLGESPDGSNATGNSTSQAWYNYISSEQRNYLAPKLKRLTQILFAEEPKLTFKFNPLRKLDALEEAELKAKMADMDTKYIAAAVLDPQEVADSRFGGEEYSTDTQLDEEARAAGLIGAPGGGDPNDPNGGGGLEPQTDGQGNELQPGAPGTSPQGFEPPPALLMAPGEEDANLAEADPNTPDAVSTQGTDTPTGVSEQPDGEGESPQDQVANPAAQQAAAEEQGKPEAALEAPGAKPPVKKKRQDAGQWEEGKHKRAQGGKFGSGGSSSKGAGSAAPAGDDAPGDDAESSQSQAPSEPVGKDNGDGTFEMGEPSSIEEAAQLEVEFKAHTDAMFQALQQAQTPQERELVRQAYQASYAEYQQVMAPFLNAGGNVGAKGVDLADKPKSKKPERGPAKVESKHLKFPDSGSKIDAADALLGEDDGEDDQSDSSKPFRAKLKAKGMLGEDEPEVDPEEAEEESEALAGEPELEDDELEGEPDAELGETTPGEEEGPSQRITTVAPGSVEGQSLGREEGSGGNDFDLRNSEAPKPENAMPETAQMVSQMMSEPMRDPRTDPKLPGPGTPKRHRTILPTRGTGMTAPSGSDPAQSVGKGEAPEEEARETQDAAPWSEGKHKRATNGKFGSGGGAQAPKAAKAAPAKPAAKGKVNPKGEDKPKGKPQESLTPDPVVMGTAILEKIKEQATEHGDAEHQPGGVQKRAACIIVRRGEKFLMGKRRDGKWALPGGHVEKGESHHQGAVREMREETGLEAKRLKFLGARMVEPQQGVSVHVNLYEHKAADNAVATGRLDPDREFAEYRWVHAANQLPEDIAGNLAHPNNIALLHLGLLK